MPPSHQQVSVPPPSAGEKRTVPDEAIAIEQSEQSIALPGLCTQ